jgi:hypothetical protein
VVKAIERAKGSPIANHDDNQHAADENLRLQNLWDAIEVYATILATVGNDKSAWPYKQSLSGTLLAHQSRSFVDQNQLVRFEPSLAVNRGAAGPYNSVSVT